MSFCPFTHPLLDSRSHQTVSSRFTAMTGHHLANGCLTNPKTPAGTQAHFTFPSKVSLLFSIRTEGRAAVVAAIEGRSTERRRGELTGKH